MKRVLIIPGIVLLSLVALVWFWLPDRQSPESLLDPIVTSPGELNLVTDPARPLTQPILVLIDSRDTNVFASYVTQILKAHGIFSFETIDLAKISFHKTWLTAAVIVCATSSPALIAIKDEIYTFAANGGNVLMFTPDSVFDSLLGVESSGRRISGGYVRYENATAPDPLQFFGDAVLVKPVAAMPRSGLLSRQKGEENAPGHTMNSFGHGRAAMIAFDPGFSTVITRQGFPRSSSASETFDADGDGVFKTTDLFYESIDYSLTTIPQADVHNRFLVDLLSELADRSTLIPRIWYFPENNPCVALLTGDSHGEYWKPALRRFADYAGQKGGKYSAFGYVETLDSAFVTTMGSHGHSVRPHLYYERPGNRFIRLRQLLSSGFSSSAFLRPTFDDIVRESKYSLDRFRNVNSFSSATNRFHFLIWWGWGEPAQLLSQLGVRMDLSITGMNPRFPYHTFKDHVHNSPGGYGYINGSGLPMKFVNREGTLINMFSQLTQFEDDVAARGVLSVPPVDSATTRRLINITRQFIDDATDRYPAALVWNFHPEHSEFRWPDEVPLTWEWYTSTVNYLAERDIPMLSVDHWLRFVEGRHGITVENVRFDPVSRKGEFNIKSPGDLRGLTILLPAPVTSGGQIRFVSGHHKSETIYPQAWRTINGVRYAAVIVDLAAGTPLRIAYAYETLQK